MEKFLMIVQLVPAVIQLMKSIEEAIPGQGQGAAKIAAVRQILEVTVDSFNQVWPALEKVIAALVSVFNATGVFKK